MTKRRSFVAVILLIATVCLSILCGISVMAAIADGTAPEKDGEDTYLIGTADELFAFAKLANEMAEADGTTRTVFKAKLTADIHLNPGVTFHYDHETGFVTVAKGDISYRMGTGMKNTLIGDFHPVYNGLCTQEEWDSEDTTDEQREEWKAQMAEKIAVLELRQWTPIGKLYSQYIGYFDGNGHTIDGLYINDETIGYTGLFGVIGNYSFVPGTSDYGEVKNVTIGENSLVVGHKAGNKGSTGAVVGMTQFDKITDCTNNATVVGIGTNNIMSSASGLVGGIVGYANGTVENCVNRGTVVSCNSAGGIVGNVMGNQYQQGCILNCSNYGNVYAQSDVYPFGWAAGIAVNSGDRTSSAGEGGRIEGCINYGHVEGRYTAGILSSGEKNTRVRYCANRGDVYATGVAAGIVRYIGRDGFTMEGCYNAGRVAILSCEGDAEFEKLYYPLAAGIYTYSTDGTAASHTVKNCYNDKSICSAEYGLVGAKINAEESYSVTPEFFATGEPAYKMGSNSGSGWRQNLPVPAEDGKSAETYPTIDGTRRVYYTTHYCCHTDSANKEKHKTTSYTNSYLNETDEHTPDENGICSHCGKDVRPPRFTPDEIVAGKQGKRYDVTIRLDSSLPTANGNIRAVVSETDDTAFTFTNGLTGTADYTWGNGYYYVISGIPTKAGTITFTLVAENENGVTKKTYTLRIEEGDPLAIDTEAKLENGTVGESYWRTLLCYTTSLEKTWSLAEGSTLPAGLTLSEDGTISGQPTSAGNYTFTVVLSAGGQTAQKTFTLLVLPEGGCTHEGMKTIPGKPATCTEDGIRDHYHCDICGGDFADAEGKNKLYDHDQLTSATGHTDKDLDGRCDFCHRNMPVFRRQIDDGGVVYGGTYILVVRIGGKYYALAAPERTDDGREYDGWMPLCEVTPDENGDFSYTALEKSGALMLKTEFAVPDDNLDAGIRRYGLGTILDNTRYDLSSDDLPYFWMYPDGAAKYGYRITINDRGEAVIGSVYQEWWSHPETAGRGLLRAFAMTHGGVDHRFMSFFCESDYNGEYADYAGAEMTEYPIYLYRMVNVGKTSDGTTFVSNDGNSSVGKGDYGLPDVIDLSNVGGVADATDEGYLEGLIGEKAAGKTSVSADICTVIAVTDLGKDGDAVTSIRYSVTPKITVTDEHGNVLYEGVIADEHFNGAPITVTLYAGGIVPAQIIHYKEDGSKEYFYSEDSEKVAGGAKSFSYDAASGFVTFRVDSFSDIEILAAATEEDHSHVHDYGDLIAAKDATCCEAGMHAHYVCRECGKLFDENKVEKTAEELTIAIDPDAHRFGAWIDEVPAAAGKEGTRGHKDCELCHRHFDANGAEIKDLTIGKPSGGLTGGAVAGIVVGAVVLLGVAGFAIFWFAVRKKSFADLVAVMKKK